MRPRRSAFTLVELLVVIAIIGILVALLLPAIQAAREAARRTECANKIKQIGLALHNYHDTYNKFPPDGIWLGTTGGNQVVPTNPQRNFTWIALLLPFIEQQALHEEIDFAIPAYGQQVTGAGGQQVGLHTVQLEAFTCPSEADKVCNKGWGMSSYAGAAGWDGHRRMLNDTRRAGIFSLMDSATFAKITDGTSNTLMVGEVSMSSYTQPGGAAPNNLDCHMYMNSNRIGGGMGKIRQGGGRVVRSCLVASAAWHGWNHAWVANSFNPPTNLKRAGGTANGQDGPIWVPGLTSNYVMHPVYYDAWAMNCEWPSAGSFHPAGAMFCMADASTQFIQDNIATGSGINDRLNLGMDGCVWVAINTMSGGRDEEPIVLP
jgi:prepilin-type N-terminal cleavage/methylation domain-containing protein